VTPTLRQEGLTELVGDILLDCTAVPGSGPTPVGAPIPQANITVSLGATLSTPNIGLGLDALLLVDDPVPLNQTVCPTPTNGVLCTVQGDGGQTFNEPGKYNVFQGIPGQPGPSSITFLGVPVDPAAAGLRIYRITNVRIQGPSVVGAGGLIPVSAFVTPSGGITIAQNNPLIAGFVTTGLNVTAATANTPLLQCQTYGPPPVPVGSVTFTENFSTAFKIQGAPGTQTTPGLVYNTESGLQVTLATGATGQATQGTEFQTVIGNIPSGVQVYVDAAATDPAGGIATLVSPSIATSGQVMVADNQTGAPVSQTVVWQVTAADANAIDSLTFNIYVSFTGAPGSPATGITATVQSGFSPQELAWTGGSPIPQFSNQYNYPAAPGQNLFVVSPCQAIPLTITTLSVPNGVQNVLYPSTQLVATGGTTPYTWTVSAGALPAGMSLSSAGVLSGTPTVPGPFTFTAEVTDSTTPTPQTATQQYNFTIVPPNMYPGTGSISFSGSGPFPTPTTWIYSSNSSTPISYSVAASTTTGGSWLLVSPAGGSTSGNSASGCVTPNCETVSINSSTLPTGTYNGAVVFTCSPTTSCSNTNGQASVQVTLTLTDGALSPLPASLTFNYTIGGSAPNAQAIAVTSTGGAIAYTAAAASSGNWLAVSPASPISIITPNGVTASVNTAALSGLTAGTYPGTITLTSTGAANSPLSVPVSLTVTQPLTITTTSLPNGVQNVLYPSTTLVATGGTAPYTWTVSAGALPAGLTLNSLTGQIAGTPTAFGPFSFTAKVTDSTTPTALTATQQYNFTIEAPLTVTTLSVPNGVVNVAYTGTQLAATGGATPYTWTISAGALPAGMTISSAGLLSGTPTASGSFSFTVKVTDSTAPTPLTATQPYSFTIGTNLTITTTSVPNGVVNVVYPSTQLAAQGGITPYTWTISAGALPAGMTLSSAGVLSGTPTTAGPRSFTAKVTDSSPAAPLTATQPYSFTIGTTLAITTTTVPNGVQNVPYPSTQLVATGGTTPYIWTIGAGALPAGMSLSPAGVVSGVPTASGPFSFTAKVTDSTTPTALTAAQQYSFTIEAGLTITTTTVPNGAVTVPYPSTTLQATGGITPYTWTIGAGALPAGLTMSSAGVVSGTPTTAGPFSFTVKVTDSTAPTPLTATQAYSGTIGVLAITTATVPNGVVTVPYPSTTLQAQGGTTPYTWTISAGALAAGMSLSSTGTIGGTPTTLGPFSFTAKVTDSTTPTPITATKAFTGTIEAPLTITTATVPNGVVNVAYTSTQLVATGGATPYTWTISAGALPAGMTLSSAGVVSGTPTTAGPCSFTAKVTDSTTPTALTATQAYNCTIESSLTITTPSPLASGTVGASYSQTLAASGGTPPYTWSLAPGPVPVNLPAGLLLNASTGQIRGTPTSSGASSFCIQVIDGNKFTANKCFALTINPAPTITSNSQLPAGTVGVGYSQTLTVGGGTPPCAWTVVQGTLPAGLALNATTGRISGTPTTATVGNVSVEIQVKDANGAAFVQQFLLTINLALAITTNSPLPSGTVGVNYLQTLTVNGGTAPYTWALTAGTLPAGLSLNPATGQIGGSPTAAGASNFSIQVRDSQGLTATKSFSLSINVAFAITTSSPLPAGTVGTNYSQTLTAAGGSGKYTWGISTGALPAGLSLNPATGGIGGTPTASGAFNFSVQVTDSTRATATSAFALTINPALTITSATLPSCTVGANCPQTISLNGGTAPYTYAVTAGALPAGLSLNSTSGQISGTPATSGVSSFTIRVTDSNGATASQQYSLTVNPPPSITTTSLTGGTANSSYTLTLQATGGTPPYTWTVSAGALPAGITLNSATGQIGGKPTASGTANFAIQVTDANGAAASAQFTLMIAGNPAITTASLPPPALGSAYSTQLAATGTAAPFTWSVSAGALPGGLTLSTAGLLSGTPIAPGTFAFTVLITDASNNTASVAYSLTVAQVPLSLTIQTPSSTATPQQQIPITLTLPQAYPVDLAGELVLQFTPNPAALVVDPAIQFSTGGGSVTFQIPAGQTTAVFPQPALAVQTGTVAGAIALTASATAGGVAVTLSNNPQVTVNLPQEAPAILSVSIQQASSGFNVEVTGYSNTREITQATFTFTPATGSQLQTTSFTPSGVTAAFQTWYASDASTAFGSQFLYTQPFTITAGSVGALQSVTVTLTNSQGTSSTGTANF